MQFTSIRANGSTPTTPIPSCPNASPANGLLFALVSASLYGLNIVYARMASFAGASGSAIVVYRVFLMLVLVGSSSPSPRSSLQAARDERGTLASARDLHHLRRRLLSLVGRLSSRSTVAAVVFYTFPILIVLASPFVDGTRLTRALLGVVALASLGVVLVVGPAFGDLDWRGLALAFGASIATATQFFAAARCRKTGVDRQGLLDPRARPADRRADRLGGRGARTALGSRSPRRLPSP